jgi:hypothetical protein
MGFGDRLKGLRDQAQQTVAENKDRIQGAVQSAGEAANVKTHGKYADKIAKVGGKVTDGVDKFADSGTEAPDPAFNIEDGAPEDDASSAPVAKEPENPVRPSSADAARAGFPPEFE